MYRTIRWNRVLGSLWLAALVFVWGIPQEAAAYSFCFQETNGRIMHWKRDKFPLNIVFHKDGSPTVPEAELSQVLATVFSGWNGLDCTYARLTGGSKAPADDAPVVDGVNMIKFITKGENWQWGKAEILVPILTTNTRTGEIRDADFLLNSWEFKFSRNATAGQYDLESILNHGVGRILGLCDSNVTNATMYGAINPGETGKRQLAEDDKRGICDLYPKDSPCKEGDLIGNDSVCFNGRVAPICPVYSPSCQACRSSADCRGANNHCLFTLNEARCGSECGIGGACPQGYNCISVQNDMGEEIAKNCAPDTNSCIGAPALPCCRSSDDCLPGFSCDLQVCKRGTTTDPCNGQCNSAQLCEGGKCVSKGCSADSQCGVGWKCVNSRCTPSDGCAAGCPQGQECQNSQCVAVGGTACTTDGDCNAGLKCALGGGIRLCAAACSTPQDCANGYFCVSNLAGVAARGCWPATRAACDANNTCTAISKGGGSCNCVAGDTPPVFGGLLVLVLLLWRFGQRRRLRA